MWTKEGLALDWSCLRHVGASVHRTTMRPEGNRFQWLGAWEIARRAGRRAGGVTKQNAPRGAGDCGCAEERVPFGDAITGSMQGPRYTTRKTLLEATPGGPLSARR